MKKFLALILALVMALSLVACGEQKQPDPQKPDNSGDNTETTYKVAMITDYGDITDQSFNQTTYEACKAFAEANGVDFQYFKPAASIPFSQDIYFLCMSSQYEQMSTAIFYVAV